MRKRLRKKKLKVNSLREFETWFTKHVIDMVTDSKREKRRLRKICKARDECKQPGKIYGAPLLATVLDDLRTLERLDT